MPAPMPIEHFGPTWPVAATQQTRRAVLPQTPPWRPASRCRALCVLCWPAMSVAPRAFPTRAVHAKGTRTLHFPWQHLDVIHTGSVDFSAPSAIPWQGPALHRVAPARNGPFRTSRRGHCARGRTGFVCVAATALCSRRPWPVAFDRTQKKRHPLAPTRATYNLRQHFAGANPRAEKSPTGSSGHLLSHRELASLSRDNRTAHNPVAVSPAERN